MQNMLKNGINMANVELSATGVELLSVSGRQLYVSVSAPGNDGNRELTMTNRSKVNPLEDYYDWYDSCLGQDSFHVLPEYMPCVQPDQ